MDSYRGDTRSLRNAVKNLPLPPEERRLALRGVSNLSNDRAKIVLQRLDNATQLLSQILRDQNKMKKQPRVYNKRSNNTAIIGEPRIASDRVHLELMRQIDAVCKEAFALGYAAAMRSVREFSTGSQALQKKLPSTREQKVASARRGTSRSETKVSRAAARAPKRRTEAKLVEEVLRAFAPRAARTSEIRDALKRDKGVTMAFTSIRQALGELQARRSAELIREDGTWRTPQKVMRRRLTSDPLNSS